MLPEVHRDFKPLLRVFGGWVQPGGYQATPVQLPKATQRRRPEARSSR